MLSWPLVLPPVVLVSACDSVSSLISVVLLLHMNHELLAFFKHDNQPSLLHRDSSIAHFFLRFSSRPSCIGTGEVSVSLCVCVCGGGGGAGALRVARR